jgi:hypothetical protein
VPNRGNLELLELVVIYGYVEQLKAKIALGLAAVSKLGFRHCVVKIKAFAEFVQPQRLYFKRLLDN